MQNYRQAIVKIILNRLSSVYDIVKKNKLLWEACALCSEDLYIALLELHNNRLDYFLDLQLAEYDESVTDYFISLKDCFDIDLDSI